MSKCTDPLGPLEDFGRFTSAVERLRFRVTCDEFFLRLVEEPPPFASFLRSVCDPSFACAFVSFVRPLVEGTLVCTRPPLPCPTTCFVFFGVCVAGLVEGECVSAAKVAVSNWYLHWNPRFHAPCHNHRCHSLLKIAQEQEPLEQV